jgi:uncharacterized protein YndB with AHSA1/START domain
VTFRIHLKRKLAAPPRAVWKALALPEGLARWQADGATGAATPGGSFELHWPTLGASIELEVVDAIPDERLLLRAGESELEMCIDNGSLTLTHTGLESDDQADGMTSAWHISLAQLGHYLSHHDGRDREVQWFLRRVKTHPSTAHAFFTMKEALGAWLCVDGFIGEEGSDYRLKLAGGRTISGKVLAHTPGRDVALSWEEDGQSVITLRTLPSPFAVDERLVAIVWSRWGKNDANFEEVCTYFEAAIDRLGDLLAEPGQS